MTSSYKPLARRIRQLVRTELRGSRNQWKEYKRVRRRRIDLSRARWLVVLYPLAGLFSLATKRGYDYLVVLLSIYTCATVLNRSNGLAQMLYGSGELAFYMHTPVTDSDFFDYAWRGFLRSSVLVWLITLTTFTYLGFRLFPFGISVTLALAAATIHWLFTLSLILAVSNFLPTRNRGKVLTLFGVFFLIVVFLPEPQLMMLDRVLLFLPPGWVPYLFEHSILLQGPINWFLCAFTILPTLALPIVAQRYRKGYPERPIVYPLMRLQGVKEVDYEDDEHVGLIEYEAPDRSISVHEHDVTEIPLWGLQNGKLLERRIWNWLTMRERAVAEFLCGAQDGFWTANWIIGTKVALLGLLVLVVPFRLAPWVYFAFVVVATAFGLPWLGGRWLGMQLKHVGGGNLSPAYAGMPLSYNETSRVMLKINLVRFLAWMPIFLLYGAALGWRLDRDPLQGIFLGSAVFFVLLTFQPIAIQFQHSYGTNDSQRLTLQSALGISVAAFLGLCYIACVTMLFVSISWAPSDERLRDAVVMSLGAAVFPCAVWLWYRSFYDRGRMDLLKVR